MIELKDQIGHVVKLENLPKKIVSLVPSQTEYLADLGLEAEVIGITKFCVHPKHWRKTKVIVGGTKKLHLDKIISLKPDLIIANKEENNQNDILELQKYFPVYTSDIITLEESFKMMADLGTLSGKVQKAKEITTAIQSTFKKLEIKKERKVAYVIWQNPLMLASQKTFINSLLTLAGFKNIVSQEKLRYPEITIEALSRLKPDYILLSSEPFPFKEKHQREIEKHTGSKVILVDGEIFSWYGSRMLHFTDYISQLKFDV